MGEIADMMIEGQMCQWCGEIIGDGDDVPVVCGGCQKEHGVDKYGEPKKTQIKKVTYPECGKKVKPAGLAMHCKDVHGKAI